MPELSRRDFLKIVRNGFLYISGGLVLGGLLRYLDHDANPAPQTEFDLGPASNYPLHSRTVISEPPAMLVHTERGFFALSLICTHLGCTVEKKDQGFACPCHGSHYDEDGRVTHGPAEKPLKSLHVEVTADGNLKLFTV